MADHGLVAEVHEGLRAAQRQRPEPRAEATDQDESFAAHCCSIVNYLSGLNVKRRRTRPDQVPRVKALLLELHLLQRQPPTRRLLCMGCLPRLLEDCSSEARITLTITALPTRFQPRSPVHRRHTRRRVILPPSRHPWPPSRPAPLPSRPTRSVVHAVSLDDISAPSSAQRHASRPGGLKGKAHRPAIARPVAPQPGTSTPTHARAGAKPTTLYTTQRPARPPVTRPRRRPRLPPPTAAPRAPRRAAPRGCARRRGSSGTGPW